MEIVPQKIAANIYEYKIWIKEIDPEVLRSVFEYELLKAGFKIAKFADYHFPEKGYTCFWLLAESHLAIHTFPDDFKSYVELSSCNEKKLKEFSRNYEGNK